MYTLNKILDLQESFATDHGQINDYAFDLEYSYESKPDLKFPLLWCDLVDSPVSESNNSSVWKDGFTFDVRVVDLVREDKSNERDVLSDCKLMLNDFLIYLRQTDFDEYLTVEITQTMKPIRLVGTDFVSGWECQIRMDFVTDPDLCGIPTT